MNSNRICNFPNWTIDDSSISHPKDIADKFAIFLSLLSSDNAFGPDVVAAKRNFDIYNLQYSDRNYGIIGARIALVDLEEILKDLKGFTPAQGKITYAMIKKAPNSKFSFMSPLQQNPGKRCLPSLLENCDFGKSGKNPNQFEG